jgi:predicted SnoaL-like aldol condensation-catalyzing enzyme
MTNSIAQRNKRLVLRAFETLFNERDYDAAESLWSPHYIQHSAHISPGREGLFDLVKGLSLDLHYEPGLVLADEVFVMLHGRFSRTGRTRNWIAVDIVRVVDGVLAEHWDVLQDEATRLESRSGLPMFGDEFEIADLSTGENRQ